MSEAKRLVVLAPNWLGDAVMAIPCVQAIRGHYPNATLALAARSHLAPLYEMVEGVDEVVPLERAGRVGGPLGVVRDARRLRAGCFDLAILFPNSFRSAAIVWFAGVPRRWGYATDARDPLLTHAVPRVHGGHMVEYYGRLVEALRAPVSRTVPVGSGLPFDSAQGRPFDSAQGRQPGTLPSARVDVPPEAREWARQTLTARGWRSGGALIGMAPGAAYGGAKQWPPERFAQVARALAGDTRSAEDGMSRPPASSAAVAPRAERAVCDERGLFEPGTRYAARGGAGGAAANAAIRSVLVGSEGDRLACDEVARIAGDAVINLCGQTDLRQLAAIIAECRAFVSNDSGAMHLAAAVGVPVVAIFGSTNEKETAPLPLAREAAGGGREPEAARSGDTVGPELQLGSRVAPAHVILTADVPCRPCMLRECPIEGHPCMTGISAARVLEHVQRFLEVASSE